MPRHAFNEMPRRAFLGALIGGVGTLVISRTLHLGEGDAGGDQTPKLSVAKIELGDMSGIRDRAEALDEQSVEALAAYLLDSEHISFDPDSPRVKTSMQWAAQEGVFPLVNPKGDLDKSLEHCGPVAPVQKPLLVLLALINDVGIDVKINSLSTSSDHGQTSHHYQGRAADIATSEHTSELMKFVNALHKADILPMDELFAPGNPGGYGLNEGKASSVTEGDHVHFSVKATKVQERMPVPTLFDGKSRANKVAAELGINAGSIFNVTREQGLVLAKAAGFDAKGAKKLLSPLFPAEVVKYKEAIEDAAEKYKLSPNFIAGIMTIESTGRADVSSKKDAHGIIQVVPIYHRERIDRIAGKHFKNDQERSEYLLKHPKKSIEIGADYLAELVVKAREENPDLHRDHPAVYARAAAGYNGGPPLAGKSFSDWPLESQKYSNFMSAFYVDTCIAGKLRESGMHDDDISDAMKSESMYARMVTFRALGASTGEGGYGAISKAYRKLEGETPGCGDPNDGGERWITDPVVRALYNLALPEADYSNFEHRARSITPGLPPALTFVLAHGVINMYNGSEVNRNQAKALAKSYPA